jgi:predicted RNA-binding protein YlxR (DUF448 family)
VRVKKIPQRTCLGCRSVKPKKELVRIVRTPDGEAIVDLTGKKSGRGAYICPNVECLEKAFKGNLLGQALEFEITASIKEDLKNKLLELVK